MLLQMYSEYKALIGGKPDVLDSSLIESCFVNGLGPKLFKSFTELQLFKFCPVFVLHDLLLIFCPIFILKFR